MNLSTRILWTFPRFLYVPTEPPEDLTGFRVFWIKHPWLLLLGLIGFVLSMCLLAVDSGWILLVFVPSWIASCLCIASSFICKTIHSGWWALPVIGLRDLVKSPQSGLSAEEAKHLLAICVSEADDAQNLAPNERVSIAKEWVNAVRRLRVDLGVSDDVRFDFFHRSYNGVEEVHNTIAELRGSREN